MVVPSPGCTADISGEIVSDQELPPTEADVEQVNSELNQGIQNCRSVVANYRTLLSSVEVEAADNDNEPEIGGADEG